MMLSRIAVVRPIAVLMFTVLVAVFGVISWFSLPRELLPDISLPSLTVIIRYAKASPQDVESMLTRPVEEALSSTRHLKRLTSVSREGVSLVFLTCHWGANIDLISLEVREKLDSIINHLPADIENPQVTKSNPFETPFMILSLSGKSENPGSQFLFAGNRLKEEIQKIPGIASASLFGIPEKEIRVDVRPESLNHYRLDIIRIIDSVKKSNVNEPAGTVKGENYDWVIRTVGEVESEEELASVSVIIPDHFTEKEKSSRVPYVMLGELARIYEIEKERESVFRFNGKNSLSCVLYSSGVSNCVQTAADVRKIINRHNKDPNSRLNIDVVYDQSEFIRRSVRGVGTAAVLGMIFAFGVLFLFLGSLRFTVIVFAVIPLSVLSAATALYLAGFTLNMMSLGGIAIVTGMLVDHSIVIQENTQRCFQESGISVDSVLKGVCDVSAPITASVLTTVSVFFPFLFFSGLEGALFKDLAWSVILGLVLSVILSFILIPWFNAFHIRKKGCFKIIKKSFFADKLQSLLFQLIKRHRFPTRKTLPSVLVLLGVSFACLFNHPREWVPVAERGEFWIKVMAPAESRFEALEEKVKRIEQSLEKCGGIEKVVSRIGYESRLKGLFTTAQQKNTAQIIVFCRNKKKGESGRIIRKLSTIMDFNSFYPFEIEIGRSHSLLGEIFQKSSCLKVRLLGDDKEKTNKILKALKYKLSLVKEIEKVELLSLSGSPEVALEIDRNRSFIYGISSQDIAETLRAALKGVVATTVSKEGVKTDVRVRYHPGAYENISDLGSIPILSPAGNKVPLREVAFIYRTQGPSEIRRENGERVSELICHPLKGNKKKAQIKIKEILSELNQKEGVRLQLNGSGKEESYDSKKLIIALLLTLLMIYMVLAAQFESFLEPFIILLTVPFSITGVIPAWSLTSTPVSIMSLLGLILLGGVSVNNGIILIEFIHQYIRRGVPIEDAVVQASVSRFRPVLMNTLTTVLAVFPFLLSENLTLQFQAPIAITLAGGLIASTIMTLYLIPSMYLALIKLKRAKYALPAR